MEARFIGYSSKQTLRTPCPIICIIASPPPPLPLPKVGDGTTSVVLLAGEILKNCKPFIEDNVHPQIIVRGLRKATQLALSRIKDIAVHVKRDDPE